MCVLKQADNLTAEGAGNDVICTLSDQLNDILLVIK